MSYETEFMKEFEEWIKTQVMINEMALEESKKVFDEDQDERAKIAMIRYESRLDAYQFLQGKFENFHASLVKENTKMTLLKAFYQLDLAENWAMT